MGPELEGFIKEVLERKFYDGVQHLALNNPKNLGFERYMQTHLSAVRRALKKNKKGPAGSKKKLSLNKAAKKKGSTAASSPKNAKKSRNSVKRKRQS